MLTTPEESRIIECDPTSCSTQCRVYNSLRTAQLGAMIMVYIGYLAPI